MLLNGLLVKNARSDKKVASAKHALGRQQLQDADQVAGRYQFGSLRFDYSSCDICQLKSKHDWFGLSSTVQAFHIPSP